MQVYSTDGSGAPVQVTGPALPTSFASPDDLIAVGDEFFFRAKSSVTGFDRVFQLDDGGTTATQLALPGIGGVVIEVADLDDQVGVIAFVNGVEQIFVFTPGSQPGQETGLAQLTSFDQSGFISDLTRGGDDEFYFVRTTVAEGRELWMIDGTAEGGARLLQDINLTPIPASYDPQQLENDWA
jgi:ELWxxDGT repeat protein